MNPQEIPVGLKCFRKIHLVLIFCIAPADFHSRYDGSAEVMQNGACPYLLYDVLIFFRVECFEA